MKNKNSSREVPVQKGRIDANMPTNGHITHEQRVKDREMEIRDTRKGQHLDYSSPRKQK